MKNLLLLKLKLLAIAVFFSCIAHAEVEEGNSGPGVGGGNVHFLLAPVIGYQSLERSYPYDHHEGMLSYGGRIVVGTYELAGEFEAQFGSASEAFLNPQVSVDTNYTQLRLGARRIFPVSDPIHVSTRVGMEAYHYSNTYHVPNQPDASDASAWQFRPYLGAGLIFYLFKSLSLSVEEVYVVDSNFETGFGFRLFI